MRFMPATFPFWQPATGITTRFTVGLEQGTGPPNVALSVIKLRNVTFRRCRIMRKGGKKRVYSRAGMMKRALKPGRRCPSSLSSGVKSGNGFYHFPHPGNNARDTLFASGSQAINNGGDTRLWAQDLTFPDRNVQEGHPDAPHDHQRSDGRWDDPSARRSLFNRV